MEGGGAKFSAYGQYNATFLHQRHTVHLRPIPLLVFTVAVVALAFHHAVRIEPILPLSYLPNLLIAILVLFVAIRPRRIINVVPVLGHVRLFFILLALLSPPALALLAAAIETVHIIVISLRRPIRKRSLGRRNARTVASSRL